MTTKVEVIVGTQEFLLGYKIGVKNEENALTQSFADKSHSGTIKCVAVQGQWIATGAADDRIFIYNMRLRTQTQIILTHEGTINTLCFTPDETHLLSGADDGQMVATRLNTWLTEANWKKAHTGAAVTHICCHPSGKLALSLGSDLVLRTWNLVKGRVAYKTNLKSRNTLGSMPDCLAWSLSGDYFSISGQRVVEIWSIKSADVMSSIKTTAKPVCVSWVSNEACLIGLEDGKIVWITVNEEEEEKEILISAHNARVKAMCFYKGTLATASSSGEIKVWQVNENKRKLKEIAATNIGCRPTCIGLLDLEQFGNEYEQTHIIEVEQENTVQQQHIKPKTKPKGVVTIEYENEEDNFVVDDIKNSIKSHANSKKRPNKLNTKVQEQSGDESLNSEDDLSINESSEEESSDNATQFKPLAKKSKTVKKAKQSINNKKVNNKKSELQPKKQKIK